MAIKHYYSQRIYILDKCIHLIKINVLSAFIHMMTLKNMHVSIMNEWAYYYNFLSVSCDSNVKTPYLDITVRGPLVHTS
jgi:hypothetical protein